MALTKKTEPIHNSRCINCGKIYNTYIKLQDGRFAMGSVIFCSANCHEAHIRHLHEND